MLSNRPLGSVPSGLFRALFAHALTYSASTFSHVFGVIHANF